MVDVVCPVCGSFAGDIGVNKEGFLKSHTQLIVTFERGFTDRECPGTGRQPVHGV